MKTTLIQIDPHDDLTSIKDKMTWAKSPRMLLFFPHGYPLNQSPLTMKLIRRYAETNGSRVALITRDRVMREIAEEQGIHCFSSAPQAEKKSWGTINQTKPLGTIKGVDKITELKTITPLQTKSKRYPFQKIVSVFLFLGVGVFSLLFFIPSAHIVLYPVQTQQQIEYQVIVNPGAVTVDISGNIPSEQLSIQVSGDASGSSSGKVVVPKAKATGEISITNQSNKTVTLPKGTIVSTSGFSPIEFYLTSAVSLAPSAETTIKAPIEAVMAGESGNVDSGMIITIGGLDNVVSLKNLKPTLGGLEQSFPTPTENDYKKLEEKLRIQLLSICKEDLIGKTKEETILIENTIELGEENSRNQIPAIGEPSDSATLSMTVTCGAIGYLVENEKQLAKMILDQNLENGLMPLNDIINIEKVTGVSLTTDEKYFWTEQASRELMPEMDKQSLVNLLSGKSDKEASNLLNQAMDQTKPAEISIKPAWWSWMPMLPNRIVIEIGRN